MKKVFAVICLVMAIITLASCTSTMSFDVKSNGATIVSQKIEMTEEEYNLFLDAFKSEDNDVIDSLSFKKTTNEKNNTVYVSEQAVSIPVASANSYFEYGQPTSTISIFETGKLTGTDAWGKTSSLISAYSLANSDLSLKLSFPYKIVETNGTLEDEYTVMFDTNSLKQDCIYVTTTASTATWTIQSDKESYLKNIYNSYIDDDYVFVDAKMISKSKALVSWDKVDKAKLYMLYRKVGSGDWKLIATTSALKYTQKNIQKGTKYYYKIKAKNDYCTTSMSYPTTVATVTGKKSKITEVWTSGKKIELYFNGTIFADGYQILMSKNKNGKYKSVGNVSYYYDSSFNKKFKNSGTYYFKVRAYQKYGKSKWYGTLSKAKKVKVG